MSKIEVINHSGAMATLSKGDIKPNEIVTLEGKELELALKLGFKKTSELGKIIDDSKLLEEALSENEKLSKELEKALDKIAKLEKSNRK